MEKWPNFFIVGVSKGGTTSLYNYLQGITGIFLPIRKESHYFSRKILPQNHSERPIRNKSEYLKLFEKASDKSIIVDASATHLSDPDAPKLIHEVSPKAKILISIRNPIERAYSAYLMHWSNGTIKKTFLERILYELNHKIDLSKPNIRLPAGFYYEDVKRYSEVFGKENLKIIIFENWIKDPKKTIEEILKFVNLNYKLNNFHANTHNKFSIPRGKLSGNLLKSSKIVTISKIIPSGPRKLLKNRILKTHSKPDMDYKSRKTLFSYYREDVLKLGAFLDNKLPWPEFF